MFFLTTLAIALASAFFYGWLLKDFFKSSTGSPEMRDFVRGAQTAFLGVFKRQCAALAPAVLAAAAAVFLLLVVFTPCRYPDAAYVSASFLAGVLMQVVAAFACMRFFSIVSLKTAAAVKSSLPSAFNLALRSSGALSMIVLGVNLAGSTGIFFLCGGTGEPGAAPLRMAGSCFGSVFAALFMRLSGGLYCEAARALSGEPAAFISFGNEARANLGLSSDMLDSCAAGVTAAMILGAALWPLYGAKAVIFPLFSCACGLASCAAGIMNARYSEDEERTGPLDRGLAAAAATALVGLFLGCTVGLEGNIWLFTAALIGVVSACLFTFVARYYGEYKYRPARMVAEAASDGDVPAVIRALSSGCESAAAPAVLAAAAVMGSYYCGVRGLEGYCSAGLLGERACGIYGVAAAVTGMLSVSGYVLSLGTFGAVTAASDDINAMTHQDEALRSSSGALAAIGGTFFHTSAGYIGASALFTAVLLFSAYISVTSFINGLPFEQVNFAGAEGLAGGLLGAMIVFLFCAFCLRAGASAAAAVTPVTEEKEFFKFVLSRMKVPAALVLGLPVIAALMFRRSGRGPEFISAIVISCVVSGALMSAFARNAAASLESSMVYTGASARDGGLGTAVLVFKDMAGPALNILVKFLPAMALALAALFI